MRAVVSFAAALLLAAPVQGSEIRLLAGIFAGDLNWPSTFPVSVLNDHPPEVDWQSLEQHDIPLPSPYHIARWTFTPDVDQVLDTGSYSETLVGDFTHIFDRPGRVQTYHRDWHTNASLFYTFPWSVGADADLSLYNFPWVTFGPDDMPDILPTQLGSLTRANHVIDAHDWRFDTAAASHEGNVELPDQWKVTALEYTFTQVAPGGPGDYVHRLDIIVTAIPEPSSIAMLLLAAIALAAYRPQKRQ